MSKQTTEDHNWWKEVGNIIGGRVFAFTDRYIADFVWNDDVDGPSFSINERLATILIEQKKEIKRLKNRYELSINEILST